MFSYPAEPGYSHRVEPGRTDLHFSTAGRVKQTLTLPSDKTESGIRLYSASALVITVEPFCQNIGRHFVRALRCHQGNV